MGGVASEDGGVSAMGFARNEGKVIDAHSSSPVKAISVSSCTLKTGEVDKVALSIEIRTNAVSCSYILYYQRSYLGTCSAPPHCCKLTLPSAATPLLICGKALCAH